MPGAPGPSDSLATVALVLGIVSVTVCGCLTGLPAVICGHIARGRIARASGASGGRGQATTGLVLGYLSLVGSIIIGIAAYVAWKKAPEFQNVTAEPLVLAQAESLTEALQKYRTQHGSLPPLHATNGELVDTKVFASLLIDAGVYDPSQKGLAISNVPSDPWLQPLNIAIDLNNDGHVQVGKQKVPGVVAVWSSGPDKKDDLGTGDDVRSW